MKKILIAALLLAAPAISMAQKSENRPAPLTPQQRAEKQTTRVAQQVTLTPEQREKIYAENLRTANAMQQHIDRIRTERKAMHAIGKQRHEAYSKILTPDQLAQLKAARKQRREARGMESRRAPRQGRMQMQAAPASNE